MGKLLIQSSDEWFFPVAFLKICLDPGYNYVRAGKIDLLSSFKFCWTTGYRIQQLLVDWRQPKVEQQQQHCSVR